MPAISNAAIAKIAESGGFRFSIGHLPPVLVGCAAIWLFISRVSDVDIHQIRATFTQVSIAQWLLAVTATFASFWAVGRYDAVMHRILKTGAPPHAARLSGAAAIAIAQSTGFGVLTGALVRWRLLPGFTLWQATRMSLAVSLSFLGAWAVITAIAVLFAGPHLPILRLGALLTLILAATGIAFSVLQPHFLPKIPTITAMLSVLGLAVLDTGFAAIALWALMPPEVAMPALALFPIFLLALGAGLLGGTPGGVGPFELTLIALVPDMPVEPVLATALAFRLVYYLVPACLGLLLLAAGRIPIFSNGIKPDLYLTLPEICPSDREHVIWNSGHADFNLIRQGKFALCLGRKSIVTMIARTGQSLVMLAGPVKTAPAARYLLRDVEALAKAHYQLPLIYKCPARIAATARSAGWQIMPIAKEAGINPEHFSRSGSGRRQMRRKLRKAVASNITVERRTGSLPFDQMAAVSDDWAQRHGGERGFSMGVYDTKYVQCQRVFLAWDGVNLVAFLTLNEVAKEWSLDLLRYTDAAPDGTMHLLLVSAIEHAKAAGCPHVSLAAVQQWRGACWPAFKLLPAVAKAVSDANGLRRFKSSFAPDWTPLYAVAPSKLALAVGLWDVFRAVNRSACRRNKANT